MSLRTYYVRRDEAVETLSSVLWGFTAKEFDGIMQEFGLTAQTVKAVE